MLRFKQKVVHVLNLVRMKESHEKNFVDEIRTPLDADVFAQVVIATTEGGPKKRGDGFWDRAEQNLLKALVLYICYDETGKRRNGTMGESPSSASSSRRTQTKTVGWMYK